MHVCVWVCVCVKHIEFTCNEMCSLNKIDIDIEVSVIYTSKNKAKADVHWTSHLKQTQTENVTFLDDEYANEKT